MQRLGAVLALSVVSFWTLPAQAQYTFDATQSGRFGLPGFSLALLEREQPSFADDPDGWVMWQKQRLAVFKSQGDWPQIIAEYEIVPEDAPENYRSWLLLRTVEAYLAQGSGESARDLLLPVIWGDVAGGSFTLAELRRLVVLSYLVDGRQADARSAMLRYEQDYSGADDTDWVAIKARVMIADGQPDEAALVAVVSEQSEGRAVYLLARLKGYAPMDEKLMQEMVSLLKRRQIDQPLRRELFVAALTKAVEMPVWAERIVALEQLLTLDDISAGRITTAADALWYANGEYGHEVANRLQLLVGDFNSWFEAAERLQASSPQDAVALYIWLVLHGDSSELKIRAHERLVALLHSQSGGDDLIKTLYLSSSHYTDTKKIPRVVIYHLVDQALNMGELSQATQLMSQVSAPEGADLQGWQLRRARLQILLGAPVAGSNLLLELLNNQLFATTARNHLVSAVFDLQSGGHYEQAYELLASLQRQLPDRALQREVIYWMADCRISQENYLEAAGLYLDSATLDGDVWDEWAQAARYEAAGALIKAGLVKDGMALYRSLLDVVKNPERRALLQRNIQRHSASH